MSKIMVIDDEHDLREMVSLFMEKEGYEVIDAENGKECSEMLKNGQIPDLILLDIMMPELNGWEVFDRLKEDASWKDIPIVFFTVRKDLLLQMLVGF